MKLPGPASSPTKCQYGSYTLSRDQHSKTLLYPFRFHIPSSHEFYPEHVIALINSSNFFFLILFFLTLFFKFSSLGFIWEPPGVALSKICLSDVVCTCAPCDVSSEVELTLDAVCPRGPQLDSASVHPKPTPEGSISGWLMSKTINKQATFLSQPDHSLSLFLLPFLFLSFLKTNVFLLQCLNFVFVLLQFPFLFNIKHN